MKHWSHFESTHSTIKEDDQGLLYVKFGVPTANEAEAVEEARWLQETFESIKQARPEKPIRTVIDMTSIDDSEFIPGDVWKMYLDLVKDPYLERVAVVGGTEAMRSIINFYFRFWAKQAVKFFSTLPDALDWLRSA